MKILWIEIRILLEKKFHPTMTPINNGFIFLLHLITHSLCENRHHGNTGCGVFKRGVKN